MLLQSWVIFMYDRGYIETIRLPNHIDCLEFPFLSGGGGVFLGPCLASDDIDAGALPRKSGFTSAWLHVIFVQWSRLSPTSSSFSCMSSGTAP